MVTTKRKRVSKKNKKSWRKNVDISDVDNFLEDQRLEERLGVKYAEQKDEDLFELDTKGEDENQRSPLETIRHHNQPSTTNLVIQSSMRLSEEKTPKNYEILEKRSAVPAAIKVTKHAKAKDINNKFLKRKLAIKASLIKRDNGRSIESEKKDVEENSFSYDVWSTENKNTDFTNLSKWLTSDTIRHNSQNTGKFKKQIPKSIHSKTSLLPAVEVPHPGLSYNPSLKDHTHILQKVAEKEVALIKEENHLNRVTTKMFSQIPKGQLEKEWISEMTVGLTATNSGTDEDDGEEYKAVNPPVRNRKKSLQKKRKKREALELKEKLKREKIEKKKLSDIYKVRIFNESLNKRDERILKNMEKRNKVKKQKPFTTRHLGQIKYEEPEIDFQLPEELSGNLRNIKAETNLLFDRFKSLQKRNILPPTVKRHVKKAKRKEYERDHTKLDWELENRESLSRKPKK